MIPRKDKEQKRSAVGAVKICGIPTVEVAKQVFTCSPDAIGVYYWKDPVLGKNIASKEEAAKIVALAKTNATNTFYLTYATTAKEVINDYLAIGFSHAQLIGEISISEIKKIKETIPELITVKVIGVTGKESIEQTTPYGNSTHVDQLLLDSKVGKVGGGTGKTHDWSISAEIVKKVQPKEVWLAGGLRTTNVREALATVRPAGIDVETGVQHPDGSKNLDTIKEFVNIVHHFSRPAVDKGETEKSSHRDYSIFRKQESTPASSIPDPSKPRSKLYSSWS